MNDGHYYKGLCDTCTHNSTNWLGMPMWCDKYDVPINCVDIAINCHLKGILLLYNV
ncbi:MAG: hypothetical protein GY861_14090 [bacterium]|nr:hypothetical protein [bacterium]